MIELPDAFRDLLLALADTAAEFVIVGRHAVAFHGHPRATKDLDVLVRANRQNAERVYRALAAFGAPLSQFEVGEADFVTYDGVLQMGVPPLRIDILNRADGITFDDAIADGAGFELEGRKIPVIGRPALLKNKKAAVSCSGLDNKAVVAILDVSRPTVSPGASIAHRMLPQLFASAYMRRAMAPGTNGRCARSLAFSR